MYTNKGSRAKQSPDLYAPRLPRSTELTQRQATPPADLSTVGSAPTIRAAAYAKRAVYLPMTFGRLRMLLMKLVLNGSLGGHNKVEQKGRQLKKHFDSRNRQPLLLAACSVSHL